MHYLRLGPRYTLFASAPRLDGNNQGRLGTQHGTRRASALGASCAFKTSPGSSIQTREGSLVRTTSRPRRLDVSHGGQVVDRPGACPKQRVTRLCVFFLDPHAVENKTRNRNVMTHGGQASPGGRK